MRLYASALTVTNRTIRGLLLPYDEWGITSVGRVRAVAGGLSAAPDLVLTLEHRDTDILGTFSVVETPEGLWAEAEVLPTRAGDDALTEINAGVRRGLSAEMEDPHVDPAGILTGVITGGSLVREPAFPSARLAASALPIAPPTNPTSEEPTMPDATTTTSPAAVTQPAAVPQPAAAAPGGLLASTGPTAGKLTASALFTAVATAFTATGGGAKMTAALSDVIPADILGIEQPAYIGQLWSGAPYVRRTVPLFNHADLTSWKVTGWRWVTKPQVGPYTGNKAAVPSAKIKTEQTEQTAGRLAGAHDVDRKFVDFPSAEFWSAYYAAMTESYARVSDATVFTAIRNAATPITSGAVPAGVAPGMAKVVDGALKVLTATDAPPTFALVATDLWRAIVLTRSDDVLAYLNAALGLEDGQLANFTLRPTARLSAGEVLVGVSSAATVHELGGEAPIRVEAPNVAQGGVDSGVFGYLATVIHDAGGLALVDKAN